VTIASFGNEKRAIGAGLKQRTPFGTKRHATVRRGSGEKLPSRSSNGGRRRGSERSRLRSSTGKGHPLAATEKSGFESIVLKGRGQEGKRILRYQKDAQRENVCGKSGNVPQSAQVMTGVRKKKNA